MKATFEHVNSQSADSSFYTYWLKQSHFPFIWHYHPELELTYIHKGKGTRLVGDHVEAFEEGDLVFLGSNLPHTWASEAEFKGEAEVIGIQFKEAIISGELQQFPEFKSIQQLLKVSHRGIQFNGAIVQNIAQQLQGIVHLEGMAKLTSLWNILDTLAKSKDVRFLASEIYVPTLGRNNEQRIDKALQHIHDHFLEPISLEKMAKVTNMTITSFCRFFKKMTGKSFSDYLNDLRIGRACKLLIETNLSISETGFKSGFNSTTHFNRMFLRKKGIAPSVYRSGSRARQRG